MTEPATTPAIDVAALAGPVAAAEFAAAQATTRPGLLTWLHEVAAMDDAAFVAAAARAIYDSSQANRFGGNWAHENFKASAASHLARARHRAAGHAPECRGATLYDRAYRRALRDAGIRPPAVTAGTCTCLLPA